MFLLFLKSHPSDYSVSVQPRKINILCNIDEGFAAPLTVMLHSALIHTPNTFFEVFLLHPGLSEKTQHTIERSLTEKPIKINFLKTDIKMIAGSMPEEWIGKEITNARLCAAEVVPRSIDKILYLDSDTLVLDDLNKIWVEPLGDNLLGAVAEQGTHNRFRKVSAKDGKIGQNFKGFYFNAGVLLINLKLWREKDFGRKLRDFYSNFSSNFIYPDQDCLNGCVEDRWMRLSDRWNVLTPTFYSQGKKTLKLSKSDYEILLSSPGIVHFSGNSKPWLADNDHPYKKLFLFYLSQTAWKDWEGINQKSFRSHLILLRKKIKTIILLRPWFLYDPTLRFRQRQIK